MFLITVEPLLRGKYSWGRENWPLIETAVKWRFTRKKRWAWSSFPFIKYKYKEMQVMKK